MKLLSPVQNQDAKALEVSREILRTQELNKAADKARKNMADAEADFNATLSRQKHQWSLEEEKHQAILKARSQEVEVLENRKRQAMIPVKLYEDQVNVKAKAAEEAMAEAKKAQDRADDLADRLEDKLDAVGAREQGVTAKEAKLAAREAGIDLQAEQVRQGAKKLNEDIAKWNAQKAVDEADINERKTTLYLWEQSLKNKSVQQHRADTILKEKAIQLEDERKTLERAFNRLKQ